MRRRTRRRAAQGFEELEPRTMLTGNVSAAVSPAGDFVLTGDTQGNEISVREEGSPAPDGSITVAVWSDGGTTINGQAYDVNNPLTFAGVSRDVTLSLGKGDDTVLVSRIDVARDLNINTGSGSNTVQVDATSVGDTLKVIGGSKHDDVLVDSVTVEGRFYVRSKQGGDTLALTRTNVDSIFVHMGRGRDDVHLLDVNVDGSGRVKGGAGRKDTLATEAGGETDIIAADRVTEFERFAQTASVSVPAQLLDEGTSNVMDDKLNDAITRLDAGRFSEENHDQAIDQILESIFISNLVPLPTDTGGNQQDPDEQDFQEHLRRMDDAITALNRHARKDGLGTPNTKADAADAKNFLELTREALQVIAGQTAFCDPNPQNPAGPGCEFLLADDEGGPTLDGVIDSIFSRQVRSPFPIFTNGTLNPNEVVIDIPALSNGECAGAIKEFQGVKVVVTPRLLPVWVEPWFSRARIVGFETVWVWEFVPAEFIKTVSVCNNSGTLETNVSSVTVHDRGLLHFWRFIKKDH